ncbi:201_t:CDS:1, partial [Acaulospora morrowiae]
NLKSYRHLSVATVEQVTTIDLSSFSSEGSGNEKILDFDIKEFENDSNIEKILYFNIEEFRNNNNIEDLFQKLFKGA